MPMDYSNYFKELRKRREPTETFWGRKPPMPDFESEENQGWLEEVLGRLRERGERATGRIRRVGEYAGELPERIQRLGQALPTYESPISQAWREKTLLPENVQRFAEEIVQPGAEKFGEATMVLPFTSTPAMVGAIAKFGGVLPKKPAFKGFVPKGEIPPRGLPEVPAVAPAEVAAKGAPVTGELTRFEVVAKDATDAELLTQINKSKSKLSVKGISESTRQWENNALKVSQAELDRRVAPLKPVVEAPKAMLEPPKTLYRGIRQGQVVSGGTFFTDDVNIAKEYGEQIQSINLTGKEKIADLRGEGDILGLLKKFGLSEKEINAVENADVPFTKVSEILRGKGYDIELYTDVVKNKPTNAYKILSEVEPPKPLAGAEVPPIPPEKPPTAMGAEGIPLEAPKPKPTFKGFVEAETRYPEMNRIIAQAEETVKQDRPGAFTRLAQRIPGLKQIVQWERPGLKMTGESEKFLKGGVAEDFARKSVIAEEVSTRIPLVNQLAKEFGDDVLHGTKKSTIPFLGTPEQVKSPIVGSLLDMVQRPNLYQLSDGQKALILSIQSRNDTSLARVVQGYGAEIGRFTVPEGGVWLPNVDTPDDVLKVLMTETRAVATGRGKTRIWGTAADRMAHDPTFKPILDVEKLLEGSDSFKASAAGGQTFRQTVGGKNRLEVMNETHPALAGKMEALKKRLQGLRSSKATIETNLHQAIDDFMASGTELTDLDALQSGLDIKLKAGPRKGMGISEVQKELDGIRAQIKGLRPAWEAANLKPYVFVQEGIYRYFPADQAKLLIEMRRTSDNWLVRFADNVKATAFGGDTSPITGVQTPIGVLADPIGSIMTAKGGLQEMMEAGDILRPFTITALAEDVAKDIRWNRFVSFTGWNIGGTPREFAGGFMAKLPKLGKKYSQFTESTYILVTRQSKAMFDRTFDSLVKSGLSEIEAGVASASLVDRVFPKFSAARLGQSPARASILSTLPTSYSFIRQPMTLMADAAKGYAKLATFQKLTPKERLATKVMATMAASTLVASATSAAISAKLNDEDVNQAMLDAINPDPRNGRFATITIGKMKVPIGGPYRAIFRAIYPDRVPGIPFPVPFAGIPRYFNNRINPLLGTHIDLLKNKDYYGRPILKGEFPEQLLRGLEYEFESTVPLTLGTMVEGLRTGKKIADIGIETAAQFLGTNISKINPVSNLRRAWFDDIEKYNAIPTDPLEIKSKKLTSRSDTRRKDPNLDAKLFVTGQTTSVLTTEAASIAKQIIEQNKIDPETIKGVKLNKELLARQEELGLPNVRVTQTEALTTGLTGGAYAPPSGTARRLTGLTPTTRARITRTTMPSPLAGRRARRLAVRKTRRTTMPSPLRR